MSTQVSRWNGVAFEEIPPPRSALVYTLIDPETDEQLYFETRNERDEWLAKHLAAVEE